MKTLLRSLLSLLCLLSFQENALAQSGGGFPPAAPKMIVCTTTCNVQGLKVGGQAAIALTSQTVANNATLTVNSLNFSSMPIGSYLLTMVIPVLPSAGGFAFGWTSCTQMDQTGAGVVALATTSAPTGVVSCATTNGAQAQTALAVITVNIAINNAVAFATSTFAWSQNTSNATGTNFCVDTCTALLTRVK